MGDFGIKKNASGYADPTAYEAIVEADKPCAGEIYSSYNPRKGIEEEMLILNVEGNIANFLRLQRERNSEYCEAVRSRCIMYTDVRMVAWTFLENKFQFVKKLPKEEFEKIRSAVGKHFGFGETKVETIFVEAVKDSEPEPAETEVTEATDISKDEEIGMLKEQLQHMHEYSLQERTTAEVYKQLYTELLERMMNHA